MMRFASLLAFAVLLGQSALAQPAEQRVALLIGNAQYATATTLANPANDVQLVADAARRAGFTTVTIQSDLTNAGFQRALREFRTVADTAEVAIVYYAGHGIEGGGRNWLIPTDAALASERDLPYEAVNLDQVVDAISGARLRVVILDACRNNPFGGSWGSGTRAVSRGFAPYEANDVMVIYAAAPGQTASDGGGGNSPFATALARRLPQANLPIQLLGGAVRDDVLAATGGTQRPFVSASITGTPYYLLTDASAPASLPGPIGADPAAIELAMWQGALSAGTAAAHQDYLRQYPDGRYRGLAEQAMARGNSGSSARPTPTSSEAEAAFVGRWRRTRSAFPQGCQQFLEILSVGDRVVYKTYDTPPGAAPMSEPVAEASSAVIRSQWQPGVDFFSRSGDGLRWIRCEYERDR